MKELDVKEYRADEVKSVGKEKSRIWKSICEFLTYSQTGLFWLFVNFLCFCLNTGLALMNVSAHKYYLLYVNIFAAAISLAACIWLVVNMVRDFKTHKKYLKGIGI